MPEAPPPNSRIVALRNAFFAGALLLAPLAITIWALGKIIDLLGGTFRPLYERVLPESLHNIPLLWDLLAAIVVVACITALGYLSHYVFGKLFLHLVERFVQNIPGVGAVYNSVKQIVATFGSERRNLFSKVVLVQFPRAGVWTLGFLTNKQQGEAQSAAGSDIWTVFVPTTPNPTSGFLLMLPRSEIVELEMSVGDGMKMILSGGAVMPPWPQAAKPAEPVR
ncbi:MAG: DUF502 domain-containing protein [Opitutaceae bacterium]|nr:DUF502 domain-containing protein [Opitutaceae bacterium]